MATATRIHGCTQLTVHGLITLSRGESLLGARFAYITTGTSAGESAPNVLLSPLEVSFSSLVGRLLGSRRNSESLSEDAASSTDQLTTPYCQPHTMMHTVSWP